MIYSSKNTIIVDTWEALNKKIFTDSWNEKIQRHRSPYAFRGLSDKDYPLKCGLSRLGRGSTELEKNLLITFRKYAYPNGTHNDSFWNLLASAQHHGLPTRLMDWTYSPYVALHFATANIDKYDMDGVVWCINIFKCKEYLPKEILSVMTKNRSNIMTFEMLDDVCRDFDELLEVQRKSSMDPFVLFFEPPSINSRIINQFACFTLLSSSSTTMDKWLNERVDIYKKIIIPSKLKWEIRDKIDQGNITERVLFPGLDGLCSWLRRRYTPLST